MNDAALLETSMAARMLDVSADTVRAWSQQGRLRSVRTAGGTRLFARRDVERLREERDAQRDAAAHAKSA
jgi:excisionase family DNA binding protein